MVKIAIADDESTVLLELSQAIKSCFEKKSVSYAIQTFTGGTDLLGQMKAFDLIFWTYRWMDYPGWTRRSCRAKTEPKVLGSIINVVV